jgi:hypothetical protein
LAFIATRGILPFMNRSFPMRTPRPIITLLVAASISTPCLAQVTVLSTRRGTAASASGDGVYDGRSDADTSLGHFRSIRTACVTTPMGNSGCGVGTQESGIGADRLWAVGQGGASTTPAPESDLYSSAGRSGFEAVFRVDSPARYWLSGSVRAVYATALVTLFGPGGSVLQQHIESNAETLFEDSGILPTGVYEIHMAAEATTDPSFEWGSTGADFSATLRWIPYCPADFNADGFTDFFDYDDFVACYEGDACPTGEDADFNSDGFADFFDYNGFVEAFETGC